MFLNSCANIVRTSTESTKGDWDWSVFVEEDAAGAESSCYCYWVLSRHFIFSVIWVWNVMMTSCACQTSRGCKSRYNVYSDMDSRVLFAVGKNSKRDDWYDRAMTSLQSVGELRSRIRGMATWTIKIAIGQEFRILWHRMPHRWFSRLRKRVILVYAAQTPDTGLVLPCRRAWECGAWS
jgi:hypothetical protein